MLFMEKLTIFVAIFTRNVSIYQRVPLKKNSVCHVFFCGTLTSACRQAGERLSPRTRAFGANSQVAEAGERIDGPMPSDFDMGKLMVINGD